jgi:hypothetical protein
VTLDATFAAAGAYLGALCSKHTDDPDQSIQKLIDENEG